MKKYNVVIPKKKCRTRVLQIIAIGEHPASSATKTYPLGNEETNYTFEIESQYKYLHEKGVTEEDSTFDVRVVYYNEYVENSVRVVPLLV